MHCSIFKSKYLKSVGSLCALVCLAIILSGCDMNMRDQPLYRPLRASKFFEDGRASRPRIEDTVARGHLQTDEHLYTGLVDGSFAKEYPFSIDEEMLKRGQQRYNIFCAPCHDRVGTGNGMVVQRGFRQPSSFHVERLREVAPGYYYSAITNGFGTMPSYASRISVEDRWLIAAYIQTLQLSQHATLADVPSYEVKNLK